MNIRNLKFILRYKEICTGEWETIETPFFSGNTSEVKKQIELFFKLNGFPYSPYDVVCSYNEDYFDQYNPTNFTIGRFGVKYNVGNYKPFGFYVDGKCHSEFESWFEAVREYFKFFLQDII